MTAFIVALIVSALAATIAHAVVPWSFLFSKKGNLADRAFNAEEWLYHKLDKVGLGFIGLNGSVIAASLTSIVAFSLIFGLPGLSGAVLGAGLAKVIIGLALHS